MKRGFDILLKSLPIGMGKPTVVSKTYPFAVVLRIIMLGKLLFSRHQIQRQSNRKWIEKNSERIGAHGKPTLMEILGDMLRKTGTEKHQPIRVTDGKGVLRNGKLRAKFHAAKLQHSAANFHFSSKNHAIFDK